MRGITGRLKGIFRTEDGFLRCGWKLALGCVVCIGAPTALSVGLNLLSGYMFDVWGVARDNLHRAPGWLRFLAGNYTVLRAIVQNALATGLAMLFLKRTGMRLARRNSLRAGAWGALLGAGCAAALLGVVRLSDSMRFGFALSTPQWSAATPLLAVAYVLSALGAELFLRGFALQMTTERWGRRPAWMISIILQVLLYGFSGGVHIVGMLNAALCGALYARMYEKTRGASMAVCFQSAWQIFTSIVLGMPPRTNGALYELYDVSRAWLTGGENGPMCGLAASILLAGLLVLVWRTRPARQM